MTGMRSGQHVGQSPPEPDWRATTPQHTQQGPQHTDASTSPSLYGPSLPALVAFVGGEPRECRKVEPAVDAAFPTNGIAGYQCCLSRWPVRVQPRAHTSARWTPLPRAALTSHPESAILHEGDSDVWTRRSTDAANARATDAANANGANAAAKGVGHVPWSVCL